MLPSALYSMVWHVKKGRKGGGAVVVGWWLGGGFGALRLRLLAALLHYAPAVSCFGFASGAL